jgi:hypothetical protein
MAARMGPGGFNLLDFFDIQALLLRPADRGRRECGRT